MILNIADNLREVSRKFTYHFESSKYHNVISGNSPMSDFDIAVAIAELMCDLIELKSKFASVATSLAMGDANDKNQKETI